MLGLFYILLLVVILVSVWYVLLRFVFPKYGIGG